MSYQSKIKQIEGLNWSQYTPESIIYASLLTATEFAGTLRGFLLACPPDVREVAESFGELAKGELKTDNLKFGEYHKKGDHWEFLHYFIRKAQIPKPGSQQAMAALAYMKSLLGLTLPQKAMTVASRERELPHVFEEVLKAHDWHALGYGFYAYYLQRHIFLDSVAGGHADLLQNFICDEKVLDVFWEARLQFYRGMLVRK